MRITVHTPMFKTKVDFNPTIGKADHFGKAGLSVHIGKVGVCMQMVCS